MSQRRSDIGIPNLINYSEKRIGKGFMGFYQVPQGQLLGIENYDQGRAMDAMTSRLSHRKSERMVNLRSMKGRDEQLYMLNDFRYNIELENTKEQRAQEIREKREKKRE